MPPAVNEQISNYIEYFQAQHKKISQVSERLHRKLLVVTLLSALAEGRYPSFSGDKEKFVKLIEEHSSWPDAARVSVTQLHMGIIALGTNLNGLTPSFLGEVSHRHNSWVKHHNPSAIVGLENEPEPAEILSKSPTNEERKLVSKFTHSSLLYTYRCKLVHEFREPGHGFEFDESQAIPYYHAVTNTDHRNTTTELVYPTEWFVQLPLPILTSLQEYYIRSNTNPYDSYRFGSPWR